MEAPQSAHTPGRLDAAADRELAEQLADEQLRMVWEHSSTGIVLATAFALLFAWQMPTSLPTGVVLGWVLLKLAIAIPRYVQGQIFRRRGKPGGKGWHRWTYTLLAIDGTVWGIAGAVLVAEGVSVSSIAIPCLACVAIVATYGLQARFLATAAYVVPIISLTAISQLLHPQQVSTMWGVGLFVLLFLLLATARRYERRLAENFLLRLAMAQSVKEKDAALELAQRRGVEREQALELALRKSAVKSQFLVTMSHELRTPLHGILGVARLLLIEANDSAVRTRVELIEASGAHLLELINDLLDITRIEAGQLKISPVEFDLAAEAQRVADVYAVRAEDKGLSFSFACRVPSPFIVRGDPSRLRQVLHNLLGNAVKFTKSGFVAMSLDAAGDGLFSFQIRDSGMGIALDEQAHIFEAFRQAAKTSAPLEGTGLGLTIARELAHAMGGDITCKSAPEVGSSFQFTVALEVLAAMKPQPSAAATAMLASPSGARFQVVLAEDNDLNALIAQAFLEKVGMDVERVSNGSGAVRHALREVARPDLILMDLLMPVMDGYEATREIRKREKALGLERIPIIALTATATQDDRDKCLAAGMDDFLGKPFTPDQLDQVIGAWLTRSAAMPANDRSSPPPVIH
jgi:signal transduction histidine kinase